MGLETRMYITLALVFAIGFAIIYAILTYLGAGFFPILIFVALFFLAQWYISPDIMKIAARLQYLKPNEHPDLQRMVKELAQQAGVPMPKVAISPSKEPNAYVFGRTRNSATLVVHQGLLPMLNTNELRAVLAHEIGHLRHNDVAVMAIVSFIPMLAYMIAQNLMFSSMFGGMGGNRNNVGYLILIGFLAFVVYMITQLLMLSLSRARESFADEYSADATKSPRDLASSLVKITLQNATAPVSSQSQSPESTVARSYYIVDVFGSAKDIEEINEHRAQLQNLLPNLDVSQLVNEAKRKGSSPAGAMLGLFSTHPPTYRRLLDLVELSKK
ncbi:MAG: M48 family metalloprotease [Candidatus Micrarchaeota archaeon]|nr:M48 family metalloprotease [Candidatus Micrarchaeota archaeon]